MVAKLPIINASSYYNRPTRANFGESLLGRAECFIRTALREWANAVAYSTCSRVAAMPSSIQLAQAVGR